MTHPMDVGESSAWFAPCRGRADIASHADGDSLLPVGQDGNVIEWELADPSLDD